MRSAAGTKGELVIPMLVQTPVMPFSMSASRLRNIGSTGSGMNRSNDSHPPLLALDRLAEHDQHVGAGALLVAHLGHGAPAVLRQPRVRADREMRQEGFRAGIRQRREKICRRGRDERRAIEIGGVGGGTIAVTAIAAGSHRGWPTSS